MIFKFILKVFIVISALSFWGWLCLVIESDIPIFSPYHYDSTPFPYQMSGYDWTALEFKAGVLNDGEAALKVSEFYKELGDRDSEIYWLYKAASLGSQEAREKLRKCSLDLE